MTRLIKDYTTEDLSAKIEHEGLEYFLISYLDIDLILDEDFRKLVQQFRLLYDEIITTLEDEGVDL